METAVLELLKGGGLEAAELLEIGTRYGKLACFFSLMGARVTAVDVRAEPLVAAREEARKWKVQPRFLEYDGNLDVFPDCSFDVVFTKSVLVVVPELEGFLRKISAKLRPGGRIIFLENGKGGCLHVLRFLRHRSRELSERRYFSEAEVGLVQSVFGSVVVKRKLFPPVYLFMGRKKS
jgi:SAM-dependent methyltransferase